MASRVAAGTPSAVSRGDTTRDRPSTLAPTEPFIGPSRAPSIMPDTSGAEGAFGSMAIAGAIERIGDRQTAKQQAHGHVERQRLQQIVFEQIDQPVGQRRQQRKRNRAGGHADDRAERRHRDQNECGRQAGRDDADADQDQQAQSRSIPSAIVRGQGTEDIDERLAR